MDENKKHDVFIAIGDNLIEIRFIKNLPINILIIFLH